MSLYHTATHWPALCSWFTLVVDNNTSSSECDQFVSDQMVNDIISRHITDQQEEDDLVLSYSDFKQVQYIRLYLNILWMCCKSIFFHFRMNTLIFLLQLLATSSHIDVSLSPGAQQLIQSFYLASRRARCGSGNDIPTTSFTSMWVYIVKCTVNMLLRHMVVCRVAKEASASHREYTNRRK